ncbi:hypothetical protein EG341_17395 [Chryseobacterium lactis]|nr:hypothetical protein EG341_17395 [Chryseobacterium lactis]
MKLAQTVHMDQMNKNHAETLQPFLNAVKKECWLAGNVLNLFNLFIIKEYCKRMLFIYNLKN